MIGQKSNLCQCHIPRTGFNSKTGWLTYQITLSHNSTCQFPTISNLTSKNQLIPQIDLRFISLCQYKVIMTKYCIPVFLWCKHFKHEIQQWYKLNSHSNICTRTHLPLYMLCYVPRMKMISCEMVCY